MKKRTVVHVVAREAEDLISAFFAAHFGTGRSAQFTMAPVASFQLHFATFAQQRLQQ